MTRTVPAGAGPTGASAASTDSLGNGVADRFDGGFDEPLAPVRVDADPEADVVDVGAAGREEPPAARLLTNLP